MKVLTILNSASMGGVEKTLLSCLKNMEPKDIDMTILCFSKGGTLEKDFKDVGARFIYIQKTGLILFDMIQLLFVLMKNKFDVVHSRFGFTSGGFVLAAWLARTKIFVSLHNTDPSTFKTFKNKKLLCLLLSIHLKLHKFFTKKFATKIIGHSKSNLDKNYLNWQYSDRFELIYNGVDFEALSKDSEGSDELDNFVKKEDFVILHIGSFREQKNHMFLIDCFNALDPISNNYKLILVGSGGLFVKVKERVKVLGLCDNVFFAGFDRNINKYFKKAQLFFFPSLNEGLANVLIEAEYKHVPICVADIAPLYESGYKDYHKYYFNPEDKKNAIANLKNIIADIQYGNLKSSVVNAYEFVIDNFSIQSMVKKLRQLYNE